MADPTYSNRSAYTALDSTEDRAPLRGDTILGRYRIMEACGTGGFGTVLTCWDTRLQRRVAIKRMPLTMHAGVAGAASTLAEGLAEARTSSMLAHPNIVTVFDFERDATCAYLVMEYVDGITLSELLGRVEGGTLTPNECSYLVDCVGEALQFAHDNGVLHLDIKPSNIMIDRTGVVKLCDFGMATLASATGYGDARGGTVGYMPPEQIEGGLVDERTDVFSLGVVVWQSLTGENPFAAATAERSLALIEHGPKTKLSKLVPDASGMTEEALLGALDPNPSKRTPSIADFVGEVTFALGDVTAGAASLRHLVSQAGDPEEEDDESVAEQLPFAFRYPWVEGFIARALSAVTAAWLAFKIAPYATASQTGLLACVAIFGVCAALWTPIGSALVVALASYALLTTSGGGTVAIFTVALLTCLLVGWWALVGARERHATPAVLLPCALVFPLAGAPYAGAFLKPAQALLTSVFGWLLAQGYLACLTEGFVAESVARDLVALALRPESWIGLAGCACAAALASGVTRFRPSPAFSLLGQFLGCALLVSCQVFATRMENGGIWVSPNWGDVGIGVVLWILTSIAVTLCGPRLDEWEDDYDELS